MDFTCDLRGFADYSVVEHIVLAHEDLKAVNTADNPNNVQPTAGGGAKADAGKLTALLPKASWNVIRLAKRS